jgi:hypothetical protein
MILSIPIMVVAQLPGQVQGTAPTIHDGTRREISRIPGMVGAVPCTCSGDYYTQLLRIF